MKLWVKAFATIFILLVCTHSVSYAKWTFKQKNYLGAASVCLLSLAAFLLPMYLLFIKK